MNILQIFKKARTYGDYRQSRYASVYLCIAKDLRTEAQHVYEIAHGKSVKSFDDYVILDRLCQDKIIHRR